MGSLEVGGLRMLNLSAPLCPNCRLAALLCSPFPSSWGYLQQPSTPPKPFLPIHLCHCVLPKDMLTLTPSTCECDLFGSRVSTDRTKFKWGRAVLDPNLKTGILLRREETPRPTDTGRASATWNRWDCRDGSTSQGTAGTEAAPGARRGMASSSRSPKRTPWLWPLASRAVREHISVFFSPLVCGHWLGQT